MPKTSSRFEITRAGERPSHDLGQAGVDREERDDQLRRVAEARVQEAADSRARVLGCVLRCLADQPRERDERRAREQEEQHLVRMRHVVDEDRHWREREQRPEDPASQGAGSVSVRARAQSSSIGATRSCAGRPNRICSRQVTRPGFDALGREPRAGDDRALSRRRTCRRSSTPGIVEEIEYPAQVRRLLGEFEIEVERRRARALSRGGARGLGARAPARRDDPRAPRVAARARPEARARLECIRPARRSCTAISRSSALRSGSTSPSSPRRWAGASPIRRSSSGRSTPSGSPPSEALFVGDTLASDIAGAAALGLHTCQALWFRADDDPGGAGARVPGVHPDGRADDRAPPAGVSGDSVFASTNRVTSQVLRDPESDTHNVCR